MIALPQLITDAKTDGTWQYIAEPDGSLHPNAERAMLNGCYFDEEAALRVMRFYVTLLFIPWDRGTKLNEWERFWISKYIPKYDLETWKPIKPFVLMEWWWKRVLSQLFGWKKSDGRRRYDKGFITTAKKSGKTSTLAGLPLYMILADQELEAEAYSAATTLDQSGLIYEKVDAMVKRSPYLEQILRRITSQKRVVHEVSSSWFESLAAEADSVEGKNPHLLVADELHAWRDRKFFDALMYGDIRRTQPLFLEITTAGDDVNSVGCEEYEFAKALLDPDDQFYSQSHFAFIAESGRDLDTGQFSEREWDDPAGWIEANPSLLEGIGTVEKLQAKCDEARQTPTKKKSFIRYITNRWVHDSADAWINTAAWRACGTSDMPDHEGEPCWVAVDLSSVRDLTACSSAWLCDNGVIDLEVMCWIPEEGLKEKEQNWKVPLRDWIDKGWLRVTQGASVDYSALRKYISGVHVVDGDGMNDGELDDDSIAVRYGIRELVYDPWNAHKLIERELGEFDGVVVAEHGQGYRGMSAPCKEFEKRILNRTVRHRNSPLVEWMIRNAIAATDEAENIKVSKKRSKSKIDGVVTSVMVVGRAALSKPPEKSVYKRRGVIVV